MTKEKFIELVRLSLPQDFNPALVEQYLAMAYSSFVKRSFNENKFQSEFYTKEYKDVDVLKNSDTELYYLNLPAKILNVSRKGSGVWSISVTGSPELVFVPLPDRDFKILNDLMVLKVSKMIPYTVLGSVVEFRKELIQVEKVNMRLLVQFDEYSDSDEINFPGNADIEIRDICWKLMGQHPMRDMVVDANPKTK